MINTCRLCLLVATIFFSQTMIAQESKYIIPFPLAAYNNLSVQAVLNKKDTVHLMFHTAANSLTLTEDAIKKLRSIRFDGADTVKSWGGSENSSRVSKNN